MKLPNPPSKQMITLWRRHGREKAQDLISVLSQAKDSNGRIDPIDLPVWIAGSEGWAYLHESERNQLLGGMLSVVVERVRQHVPFYRDNPQWQSVNPMDITSLMDIASLPMMSKDPIDGTKVPGFRQELLAEPMILVPDNHGELMARQEKANPEHQRLLDILGGKKLWEFGSGGSMGNSTKTIFTYLDIWQEAYALARCLTENGFLQGNNGKILCLYNDTHKGGLQLKLAADIMKMTFHSRKLLMDNVRSMPESGPALNAIETNPHLTGEEAAHYWAIVRRGIREYIRENNIQIIESVQPSEAFIEKNAKGGYLAFMTLFDEDPSSFTNVKHVFLTGFTVPVAAYERLRSYGIKVSTTVGSTEAMAWGTTANAKNTNNLTAAYFPTIAKVAWYSDHKTPNLMLARPGYEGMVYLTNIGGRAGSNYLNLSTGDFGTATEKGIGNIHRSQLAPIAGTCAEDALTIPRAA